MIKILSIGDTCIKKGNHSAHNVSYMGGVAKTHMETFHYIIQHKPDIIVFATRLGDLDSLEVYQRIRNMYAGRHLPIILLVHEEDEDLYEDFYDDGITIGLHHGIKEETLFLHIKQLVTRCKEMRKTVLIVEKDPVVTNTYRLFLEGRYQLHLASSPQDAMSYLMSEKIDAIIYGINMSETIGLSFLKILQDNPLWEEIPVIAQIHPKDSELVSKIIEKGVSDCLIKPVSKETLLERLAYTFGEEIRTSKAVVARKKCLLIVDKLGVNFHSIQNIVEEHYKSIHSLPGVRAVSLLEVESVDGIIVNLDNSLFCLNKILDKASAKSIPILLYTSNYKDTMQTLDDKAKGHSCVHCVLELPANRTTLLDKLELAI